MSDAKTQCSESELLLVYKIRDEVRVLFEENNNSHHEAMKKLLEHYGIDVENPHEERKDKGYVRKLRKSREYMTGKAKSTFWIVLTSAVVTMTYSFSNFIVEVWHIIKSQ